MLTTFHFRVTSLPSAKNGGSGQAGRARERRDAAVPDAEHVQRAAAAHDDDRHPGAGGREESGGHRAADAAGHRRSDADRNCTVQNLCHEEQSA